MPVITSKPGPPDEIAKGMIECTPTRIIVTACDLGTEHVAGAAGIRLSLLPEGPSAEGITNEDGIVTFTIKDLDEGSVQYTLASTNARRPEKANEATAIRAQDQAAALDLGSHIAAIDILDGDDVAGAGELIQVVNLPAEEVWLERAKVKNVDRLSTRIRVKVTFHHPCVEPFTVKMVAGGDNAVHSSDEKGRHAGYKHLPEDLATKVSGATDDKGVATLGDAFRATAAGGDVYRFEAEDTYGNVVRTDNASILTWRVFFLQPLVMKGLENEPASEIDTLIQEYAKYHVDLRVRASIEMAYIANVGLCNKDDFKEAARKACSKSDDAPHVVFVAFADQLAELEDSLELRSNFAASPDMKAHTILAGTLWDGFGDGVAWLEAATLTPNAPEDEELDHDAEKLKEEFDEYDRKDGEYKEKMRDFQKRAEGVKEDSSEAESLKLEYDELQKEKELLDEEEEELSTRQDEIDERRRNATPEAIDLTDHCTATNKDGETETGPFTRIVVDVGSAVTEDVTGTLEVKYRKVGYWRGGFSLPSTNLCASATRAKWMAKDMKEQNTILIHEIGHQIGMVPTYDPQGQSPPKSPADLDRHANQYEAKGHNGSHCCSGLDPEAKSYREVKEGATCVMFGSTHAPTTFCKACGSAVRRRDLGGGFTAF